MKPGKGQKGSIPHMAWWWPEPFSYWKRCWLVGMSSFSTVALSGTAVQSVALSIPSFSPAVVASRDPNVQPWSIHLLHSGTRQTSQLVMPPTHPRTDGPLYCPSSTYCCAWPSYRYFSAFQVPLVSVLKHHYGTGIQAVSLHVLPPQEPLQSGFSPKKQQAQYLHPGPVRMTVKRTRQTQAMCK